MSTICSNFRTDGLLNPEVELDDLTYSLLSRAVLAARVKNIKRQQLELEEQKNALAWELDKAQRSCTHELAAAYPHGCTICDYDSIPF